MHCFSVKGDRLKVNKKTKKTKKTKKNNQKTEPWKKPIKILKKITGSVRFYKPETEKTEPNQNKKTRINRIKPKNRAKLKKPSQNKKTKPNRFEPVFFQTKPNQNWSVWTDFGFFL